MSADTAMDNQNGAPEGPPETSGVVVEEVSGEIEPELSSQESANEFKSQGNDYLRKRQYQEAVEAYTKGVEACADAQVRGPILGNRSQAFRRLGDMNSALKDANQVVEILPTYARGHLRKAYALREMKEWKECQACIEHALGLGLDWKDNDEKNVKILLAKVIQYQEDEKNKEKLAFIMSKLMGKWNGAVPAELGGGSQELDFKSETQVILTVPARQMAASLKLDISKDPMWLDITLPIPTAPGQTINHMMPHLFKFNEDFTELHLMGPPDQGLQPGVPLRRPSSIDMTSKSYVKMSRGPALATDEEKEIIGVVEELKGKSENEKMLRYCKLMTRKLGDAVASTGFKFEEPQPSWPEEEVKQKYTAMLKMSQSIFLLEKHFGQVVSTTVSTMVKQGTGITEGGLKQAIDDLREVMIKTNMHKEAPPPQVPEPAFNNDTTKSRVEVKESNKQVVTAVSGWSPLTLVLLGAGAASFILTMIYFLTGGNKSRGRKN